MRGYLKDHVGVFEPDEVVILLAAFDKTWQAVQASGVRYPADKLEFVRAILAKHIIAAAKGGERDYGRLRDGALLALCSIKSAKLIAPVSPRLRKKTPLGTDREMPPRAPSRVRWWRRDCVAGVVGLELRNVGANYPFEKSRRFPAIQPNLVTGDGSRLSCGVADTAILDPRLYPLVIGERVRDKIAKTQLDVRPMSWPPSAKVRARLIVIELGSEMLLRSQRKLHHAFQELVRRQADEVVHDELLGVE